MVGNSVWLTTSV